MPLIRRVPWTRAHLFWHDSASAAKAPRSARSPRSLRSYGPARALTLDISRSPEYLHIMDSLASKAKVAPSRSKEENKENASTALKDPTTPPRKAPAARDKLKTLAMPKALKI